MNENLGPSREKYWDELTQDEKIEKTAVAVEQLARWFHDNEIMVGLLNQHAHGLDGKIMVPLQHNKLDQVWYRDHLLNRRPK